MYIVLYNEHYVHMLLAFVPISEEHLLISKLMFYMMHSCQNEQLFLDEINCLMFKVSPPSVSPRLSSGVLV